MGLGGVFCKNQLGGLLQYTPPPLPDPCIAKWGKGELPCKLIPGIVASGGRPWTQDNPPHSHEKQHTNANMHLVELHSQKQDQTKHQRRKDMYCGTSYAVSKI